MYEKLHAIVLHSIKYSDKNSIVHLFTKERGRMAFLLPQSKGKSARMRNALFMPLSILEIEANIIPNRDISKFGDVRSNGILTSVHADPIKNAVAMFIAELVGKVIQGNEDSRSLYSYIEMSIRLLDKIEEGEANFHICFLYHLGAFLGIQPDIRSYKEGYAFNMEEGVFFPFNKNTNHILIPQDAKVLLLLDRMTFQNMHVFKFNRKQRNELLNTMLRYYQIHNSTLGTLKSPDILSALFI